MLIKMELFPLPTDPITTNNSPGKTSQVKFFNVGSIPLGFHDATILLNQTPQSSFFTGKEILFICSESSSFSSSNRKFCTRKKNITNVDCKNLYVEFGITSNRVIEINASDPCDIPYGKNNVKHVRKLANNAIATKTCCG